MKGISAKYISCICFFLLFAACIQPFQKKAEPLPQLDKVFSSPPGRITERQLQAEVMAFADQYTMVYWQAMDQLHKSDLPPETKLAAEYGKLLYISSAMSIAAEPGPVASLLDMITFIRLGHQAVESYWVPEVYGPAGQPLIAAYQRLEEEVWQLAALVLTEAQQDTVRETIDRWRREHPNQWYVSDVHLQDFSAARGRPVHPLSTEAQGLLSSINQTLLEVDEAILVAERALFLGERMPRLITLQTELLIEQVTENPIVYQLIADITEFQKTGARMSRAIEELPRNFAVEREEVLNRFGQLLEEERSAWLGEFSAQEENLHDLLARAQETLKLGSKTAHDYTALVKAIEVLAGDEDGDDVIDKSTILAEKTEKVARELNLLLNNLDRFVSPDNLDNVAPHLREIITTVRDEEEHLIDRAFLLGAMLILMALVGSLLVAIAYRFLAERLFPRKRT
jgi:hypothetical protein